MKGLMFASLFAVGALCFGAPAQAKLPPALPPPTSTFNQGTLRVDVYGTPNKQALIFIPGLTCGPWEWSGEIARFSPNYTIYALTLPGFDGQPAVAGPLFPKVTSDFWNLLQAKNITKPIVIGHSLGGTTAIMLAEQHSDRLAGIVAVDGLPMLPGIETMTPAQREQSADQLASMIASASTPAAFEAAEKAYVLPYMITAPQDVAAVAPLVARSDPKASAAWMKEDMLLDLRPQLTAATVPALEIAPFDPQLDPHAPAKFSTAAQKQAYYTTLLKGYSAAKVQIVQPSRHFIMYDQPAALDAAITQFIQQLHP